jgi:hypothetical protein
MTPPQQREEEGSIAGSEDRAVRESFAIPEARDRCGLCCFHRQLRFPMPTIRLTAYPITERHRYGVCISLGLGQQNPSRDEEIKTVADCEAALDRFAAEITATGKPWQVSVLFLKKSGRKPAGFDKAEAQNRLRRDVNPELAPRRA